MANVQPRLIHEASGLEFSFAGVPVDGREHGVLVVEPTRPIVVGRDRLARIRAGEALSDVDRSVIETCSHWRPRVDAVVFVAYATPDRYWAFSDDLTPAEAAELGRAMVQAQLNLYGSLLEAGVYSLTGIALGDREHQAFARGTEKVAAEIERRLADTPADQAAVLRLDLWLLDHLALWTTLSRERFFAGPLPETLSLIARRRRQLEAMNTDIAESGRFSTMP